MISVTNLCQSVCKFLIYQQAVGLDEASYRSRALGCEQVKSISKSQSTIRSSQSVEYTGPRDFRNKLRLLHHDLLNLIDKGLVGILYKVFLVRSA